MFIMGGRVRRTGEIESIRWEDGKLSSENPAFLRYVLDLFALEDGSPVGPVGGPITERRHDKSALSSYMLLSEIFEPNVTLVGDLPEPPTVPYGAVV